MVRLLDDGAQDFIVKPFAERDLRVRVRNLVLAQPQARNAARHGARAELQKRGRAKDEFLAMLGHELRNPLSPILTALQLMKLRGEPGSERERTVIERQVNHLTRLVDDLLDVSRIARGRVELKTETRRDREVVAKAIEMASPLLEQRDHTLKVDVPRRGLRVDGDTDAPGPGDLQPADQRRQVHAAQRRGDGACQSRWTTRSCSRCATPGSASRPKCCRASSICSSRSGRRSTGRRAASGIGLTIVRSLIERHGGSVSARSDGPGKGSEFIIRLPLTKRDDADADTGYGQESDRRRTRDAGFDGHLVKPVDLDAIDAALKSLLSCPSDPGPSPST